MPKEKIEAPAAVSTPDTDENPISADILHPKTVLLLTHNEVLTALHNLDKARDAVIRAKQELIRRDAELSVANAQLHDAVGNAAPWAKKMMAEIGLVGK